MIAWHHLGSAADRYPGQPVSLDEVEGFAWGNIDGFGLSGDKDLSGNAHVGLGYAIGNNTDLNFSWSYLDIAYGNAANRGNSFDACQNGIESGVKFFF